MITLAGVLNVISQIEKDAKTTGDARLVKALQKVSKALGEPNAAADIQFGCISTALDEAKRIFTDYHMNKWSAKVIKKKKLSKAKTQVQSSVATLLTDMSRALMILQVVCLVQTQKASTKQEEKIVLWVDDNPENNASEVERMEELNIKVVQKKSTAEAMAWLAENSHLKSHDSSNFRVVTDFHRVDEGDDAAKNLIQAMRKNGWLTPVLVYCSNVALAMDLQATHSFVLTSSSDTLLKLYFESMLSTAVDQSDEADQESEESLSEKSTKETSNEKKPKKHSTKKSDEEPKQEVKETKVEKSVSQGSVSATSEKPKPAKKSASKANQLMDDSDTEDKEMPQKPAAKKAVKKTGSGVKGATKEESNKGLNKTNSVEKPEQSSTTLATAKALPPSRSGLELQLDEDEPTLPLAPSANSLPAPQAAAHHDTHNDSVPKAPPSSQASATSEELVDNNEVWPNNCSYKLQDPEECRVGQVNTIFVVAQDKKHHPLTDAFVEVELVCDSRTLDTYVENNDNGTYTASFFPTRAGEYEIKVSIDGKHIREGPAKIRVASAIQKKRKAQEEGHSVVPEAKRQKTEENVHNSAHSASKAQEVAPKAQATNQVKTKKPNTLLFADEDDMDVEDPWITSTQKQPASEAATKDTSSKMQGDSNVKSTKTGSKMMLFDSDDDDDVSKSVDHSSEDRAKNAVKENQPLIEPTLVMSEHVEPTLIVEPPEEGVAPTLVVNEDDGGVAPTLVVNPVDDCIAPTQVL